MCSNPPASASKVVEIIGMHHHSQTFFFFDWYISPNKDLKLFLDFFLSNKRVEPQVNL